MASSRMFFSEPCGIFEISYSAELLFAPDSWKGLLMESAVVFSKIYSSWKVLVEAKVKVFSEKGVLRNFVKFTEEHLFTCAKV